MKFSNKVHWKFHKYISVNGMILHKIFHPIVKVDLLDLTPNMFLRSGSLNLNGMLDTWSLLGVVCGLGAGKSGPPLLLIIFVTVGLFELLVLMTLFETTELFCRVIATPFCTKLSEVLKSPLMESLTLSRGSSEMIPLFPCKKIKIRLHNYKSIWNLVMTKWNQSLC